VTFTPPEIQTATLANGLELFLVEKHDLPLVEVHVEVLAGWAADPADKPGTAAVTADMLDEGAADLDALEISERMEALGARLTTRSVFDGSRVSLDILRRHLDEGLDLLADVLLRPTFPPEEFERVRKEYLGRLQQEAVTPRAQAVKELQLRLFGAGHPYAQPYTGTGSAEALANLAREDLQAFYDAWYRPNNAGVVVVGDIDLAGAVAAVERALGRWEPAEVAVVSAPVPRPDASAKIVVIDRPGAQQSMIMGGHLSLTRTAEDYEQLVTLNTAFGGQFSSRINMNLREEKGYTYGTRSQVVALRDAGFFLISAPVHTEHTGESIAELVREMRELRSTRPLTAEEIEDSRNRRIMGFPQGFQTFGAVAGSLAELVRYDLPLDAWSTFAERVAGFTAEDLAAAADAHVDPDLMTWVVVGDWEAIHGELEALDLGPVELLKRDGT
jgi:zinc protease